mmetsp:Transcript_25377/g.60359  ORF Transcript_25377/g.60359 Transcript_25377/m.60359 type:complete len:201 (+) Transcript_25377:579-1181(+)
MESDASSDEDPEKNVASDPVPLRVPVGLLRRCPTSDDDSCDDGWNRSTTSPWPSSRSVSSSARDERLRSLRRRALLRDLPKAGDGARFLEESLGERILPITLLGEAGLCSAMPTPAWTLSCCSSGKQRRNPPSVLSSSSVRGSWARSASAMASADISLSIGSSDLAPPKRERDLVCAMGGRGLGRKCGLDLAAPSLGAGP